MSIKKIILKMEKHIKVKFTEYVALTPISLTPTEEILVFIWG